MKNIAIFASGSGSNAENLVNCFKDHPEVHITLMVCNRKDAFVFDRMKRLGIPSVYVPGKDFINGSINHILENHKIDLIVLAGFLMLLPESLIKTYPHKIINVHPALLPKFGGKGMYGMHVHEAVVQSGENKTGITIHFVDENFDEGEIIEQFETEVLPSDTADDVAKKIHELEMRYFPVVVERVIQKSNK